MHPPKKFRRHQIASIMLSVPAATIQTDPISQNSSAYPTSGIIVAFSRFRIFSPIVRFPGL